jgi:hypothetical protein
VDDRFFEKHEYHALIPDQNNMMHIKCLKRGHVGKGHGGNGNGTGRTTKIYKCSLPDDDDEEDESSEE